VKEVKEFDDLWYCIPFHLSKHVLSIFASTNVLVPMLVGTGSTLT
jgi:hypothetical protein